MSHWDTEQQPQNLETEAERRCEQTRMKSLPRPWYLANSTVLAAIAVDLQRRHPGLVAGNPAIALLACLRKQDPLLTELLLPAEAESCITACAPAILLTFEE